MKKMFLTTTLCSLAAGALLLPTGVQAEGQKPKVLKPCLQCHTGDGPDVLRGKLGSVSMKAETLKVDTGGGTWLVSFDDETMLSGADALNAIDSDHEIMVRFEEEDGALYALEVAAKTAAELSDDERIYLDDLAPLVAQGPEQGKFTLVDARPGKLYLESHIPGAISIYDAQFDKNLDKLPSNKEQLLVFYCGGPT